MAPAQEGEQQRPNNNVQQNLGLAHNISFALAIITLTVAVGKLFTEHYFAVLIACLTVALCTIEAVHRWRVKTRLMVTSRIERASVHKTDSNWSSGDRRRTLKFNTKVTPEDTNVLRHSHSSHGSMFESLHRRNGSADLNAAQDKKAFQRRIKEASSERMIPKRSSEKKHNILSFKRFSTKRNKERRQSLSELNFAGELNGEAHRTPSEIVATAVTQ